MWVMFSDEGVKYPQRTKSKKDSGSFAEVPITQNHHYSCREYADEQGTEKDEYPPSCIQIATSPRWWVYGRYLDSDDQKPEPQSGSNHFEHW